MPKTRSISSETLLSIWRTTMITSSSVVRLPQDSIHRPPYHINTGMRTKNSVRGGLRSLLHLSVSSMYSTRIQPSLCQRFPERSNRWKTLAHRRPSQVDSHFCKIKRRCSFSFQVCAVCTGKYYHSGVGVYTENRPGFPAAAAGPAGAVWRKPR